jgi:hypothetical protein
MLHRNTPKPSETTVRRGFPDCPIALRLPDPTPSEFHPSDAVMTDVTCRVVNIYPFEIS